MAGSIIGAVRQRMLKMLSAGGMMYLLRFNMNKFEGKTYGEIAAIFTGGFQVTGQMVRGGRFSHHYTMIGMAMAVNLWRGSVWGILPNGKRQLIKRVFN